HFLLTLALHYQQHDLVPGPELTRLISERLGGCPALGADMEAGQHFVALLAARQKVHATLELLASMGSLQRLIPELGEAYRRVPVDAIHRHTIGEHSLRVVKALETLREMPPGSAGPVGRDAASARDATA